MRVGGGASETDRDACAGGRGGGGFRNIFTLEKVNSRSQMIVNFVSSIFREADFFQKESFSAGYLAGPGPRFHRCCVPRPRGAGEGDQNAIYRLRILYIPIYPSYVCTCIKCCDMGRVYL